MEIPTPKGAGVEARLPRKAKVSHKWPWMFREIPWVSREWPWMTRERPWVSRWSEASIEASPRVGEYIYVSGERWLESKKMTFW